MMRLFSNRYLTIEALLGRGESGRGGIAGPVMKRKNESRRSPWTIEALLGRGESGRGDSRTSNEKEE